MGFHAQRFKDCRKAKGLTLLSIAKRLGVTEATVQRWESGAIKNIKYDHIVALAEVLDCTPQFLMGWEIQNDEPAPSERDELIDEIYSVVSSLSPEKQAELLRYARYLAGAQDTP